MVAFETCERDNVPQIHLCEEHADKLTEELRQQGLLNLCAEHPEQCKLDDMLSGELTVDTFDPGAYCQVLLIQGALQHSRMTIVQDAIRDNEDKCPLCWLNLQHVAVCDGTDCKLGADGYDLWITLAVAEAVDTWRSMQT